MTAGCRQPVEPESICLPSVFDEAKAGNPNADSTPRVPVGGQFRERQRFVSCPGLHHKPRFYVAAILVFYSACIKLSVRPMEASRSFVGKMSFIAWYYVDFTESDASAACKFFQTLSHRVAGYLRVIRISVASSIVAVIARSTLYSLYGF